MDIYTRDYCFVLNKSPLESWEQFHLRKKIIRNTLDKTPSLIHSLDYIIELSFFWISYKYMNCKLKPRTLKDIIDYFGE